MEFKATKQKFVQTWGTMGSNWGINKTMAQIHALMLVSNVPLCTEDIMEELQISRGNANMNIRSLMDWGLVFKEIVVGERKEFFVAEKDVWQVFIQISKERRKREIQPVVRLLDQMSDFDSKDEEEKEFKRMMEELHNVTKQADVVLEKISKADKPWFLKLLKIFT